MRKQTKKVLSWVLAGAMALSLIPSVGLVSEKADAAVSTVDKVVFDKAVESKLVGGDSGEARLLVFNNWGKYDPNALEGISMKDASITFNVEGVADVLAKTGAKSIKAFLGLNSSDWSVNTLGNTAPADGVTEIEKDGTYTVTYTGSSTITLGNQMGVMFADIDSALEKDDDKNVTAGLKVSDTKLQLKAPALMKDVTSFDKAVESKLVGGDSGEARLLVFNNWGKYDPSELEGIDVKNASITFKVAGVADVLAKTGAKSIKAFLGLNSSDWSVNTLGNTVPANGVTEIEKDGTYTVTYTGSSTVKLGNQMGVMFADIDSALEKDDDKNVTAGLTVSDASLKVEVAADDTEGPEVTPTPEPTDAPKAYDEALWATKGIHAYLSYQMDSWDYRNGYKPNAVGKQDTYDYIKASGDATKFKATDVLLTRDGEYTVAISGIDLSSATKYNLLSIATDLSAKTEENPDGAYADVKLSVTSLKVDGAEVAKDLSLVQKADELYYYYPLINKWSSDDKGPLFEKTDAEDLAIPENSIEITFKVTGLKAALNDLKEGTYKDPETGENVKNDTITKDDIDASEGALPTPSEQPTVKPSEKPNVTPAPTNSPAPTKAPKAPKKGNKVESGKVVYKVTKAATAKKAGTLAIVGLSKAGKKASSLSAPATAKINGYSYKVTSIGKNAFKGANAKTISLGKNIKSIPAGAFANCKKLSTLKVKAKLTKVAKKAFKGCKKTIKVKGASKKVTKANVKKLKKSGYKKFK